MVQRNSLNIPWTYSTCKMVRSSANQTVPTGTGATQVVLGSTAIIKGTDLTNDAANNRIVVNRAGVYQLAVYLAFDGNNVGRRWVQVAVDGTGVARVEVGPPGNASGPLNFGASTTMALAAGAIITAEVVQTSGAGLAIINTTYPLYLLATRVA